MYSVLPVIPGLEISVGLGASGALFSQTPWHRN